MCVSLVFIGLSHLFDKAQESWVLGGGGEGERIMTCVYPIHLLWLNSIFFYPLLCLKLCGKYKVQRDVMCSTLMKMIHVSEEMVMGNI